MENRTIIYLVDSAGVYLPLQDEIFPDRNTLDVSLETTHNEQHGNHQISAIMGSCVWWCLFTYHERRGYC
jgi:acetyl-CoA carboxylase carboxyltransferase component